MYYLTFDETNQTMRIEDRDGNSLIEQRAYATKSPYPGRDWTFSQPINRTQWELLFVLVAAANRGTK